MPVCNTKQSGDDQNAVQSVFCHHETKNADEETVQ